MNDGVVIGVDLGGTKMLTALVGADGRVLRTDRVATGDRADPARLVRTISESARAMARDVGQRPVALGVGIAAQVDREGTVRFSPNLDWHDVPLRRELETALGLPVRILNDVRAATLAEWRFGAGRGERDLVCLFLGTGLGGGVVSDGRLLTGHSNAAGELGHLTVVAGGRRCTCSNLGCLEAYVGGWAIADRARSEARSLEGEAQRLEAVLERPLDTLDAAAVAELARRGDGFASRIMTETRDYLAAGLVGIANAFNPRLIVAGGGVVDGSGHLFEAAVESARSRMLPSVAEPLTSARAQLGEAAVAIGASLWAREAPL